MEVMKGFQASMEIKEKILKNPEEAKKDLVEMGYGEYFPNENVDSDHIKNVYLHAQNIKMNQKFNLAKDDLDTIKGGLCNLLGEIGTITDFLKTDDCQTLRNAKSPLDFADKLKNDVEIKLIETFIKHQFEIRWNTKSGEPEEFKYSEFCGKAGSRKLLKYSLRNAQVRVQLYKEFLKHGLKGPNDPKELCPAVYMRDQAGKWKQWIWGENKNKRKQEFQNIKGIKTKLKWMQNPIWNAVNNNGELSLSLNKPSVYWAVIDDKDFRAVPQLKLNKVGKSQVYIGESKNGIKGRWFKGNSHVKCIEKCLNAVSTKTDMQLVHARLALAYLRKENRALFLMNTFDKKKSALKEQNQQIEGFITKNGKKERIVHLEKGNNGVLEIWSME